MTNKIPIVYSKMTNSYKVNINNVTHYFLTKEEAEQYYYQKINKQTKYPGYRHMNGTQRRNARMDRIWEQARLNGTIK